MRLIYGTIGMLIVAMGTTAVVTGDSTVHGGWTLAIGLATVGCAGLLATAVAVSR